MDILLSPKPWYVRHRWQLAGAVAFLLLVGALIVAVSGPKRMRVEADDVGIAEAVLAPFVEYVNAEGTLQPIETIRLSSREAGTVSRIVAEEGSLLAVGDTILILSNPELERDIADQRAEWQRQQNNHHSQLIEMEQQRLTREQQRLDNDYELNRLEKQWQLDQEEYRMGIKSKAQLQVAEEEYRYKLETQRLQLESRSQDSVLNAIRLETLDDELREAHLKLVHAEARLHDLVVTAPSAGQLSGLAVEPSQRISAGTAIADVKRLDSFRMRLSMNEFYIDKINAGQTATITYEKKIYPMTIASTVPEIKGGNFDVFLVFSDSLPDNAHIGKSYQARIELGGQEQSVVIPKGNFYNYTHGQWIFKVNASHTRAVRVPISVGRQNPRHYEITGGLQPGDEVIITGYERISDADELVLN